MVTKTTNENLRKALAVQTALALILLFWLLATAAYGQTMNTDEQSAAVKPGSESKTAQVLMPVLKNYKEVAIGMTADEVKDKLGKAKIEDKTGFFYEFSDDESSQIVLDADKKVRAITVFYKVKDGNPPKIEDVLGAEAATEPNSNGSVYKLVRYPEAGYWVAYSRTAGDNAMVMVTIQKME